MKFKLSLEGSLGVTTVIEFLYKGLIEILRLVGLIYGLSCDLFYLFEGISIVLTKGFFIIFKNRNICLNKKINIIKSAISAH